MVSLHKELKTRNLRGTVVVASVESNFTTLLSDFDLNLSQKAILTIHYRAFQERTPSWE